MQVKTGFATIHNAKLYFEMAGKGKPLILLHSGIADHRMWVGQPQELSRFFRVVTADFRGYGGTPPPSGPFWHYEDIHELIRYLGFDSVSIVGCSLGGKTAIELTIAYPQVVDSLILVAPGLTGYEYRDKETLEKDTMLEKLIAGDRREDVADMLVDVWVVGSKRRRDMVSSGARALVRQMILDNYDSVVDKFPEAAPPFDLMPRLSEIHAPTLVMIGDSDLPDMLAISQLVTDRIPGSEDR
jgi:3-oxoadipate enol-lactonase